MKTNSFTLAELLRKKPNEPAWVVLLARLGQRREDYIQDLELSPGDVAVVCGMPTACHCFLTFDFKDMDNRKSVMQVMMPAMYRMAGMINNSQINEGLSDLDRWVGGNEKIDIDDISSNLRLLVSKSVNAGIMQNLTASVSGLIWRLSLMPTINQEWVPTQIASIAISTAGIMAQVVDPDMKTTARIQELVAQAEDVCKVFKPLTIV